MTGGGETIVTVFDTPAHAELAAQDLLAAGLPADAVQRHQAAAEPPVAEPPAPGFWHRLFGGEPEHGTAFYDRAVALGGTVLTVAPPDGRADETVAILLEHEPVDMDERALRYVGAPHPEPPIVPFGPGAVDIPFDTSLIAGGLDDAALSRAAEAFAGRRLLDRGGARVRRYVAAPDPDDRTTR